MMLFCNGANEGYEKMYHFKIILDAAVALQHRIGYGAGESAGE